MTSDEILRTAKSVLDTEIDSLKLVMDNLDKSIADVVHKIKLANKLVVSGVGKSGIIGRKIAGTFASIGVPSFFMHPDDALHGDLGMVGKGDVCLLLSKSGSTQELVEMLPYLKNRGAIIVAITGNMQSYLALNAEYTINSYVEQEGCPLNTAPMASALVALAIGDALAACFMKLTNLTIEQFSRQHPLGQIGRNLTLTVEDIMHKGLNLPLVKIGSSFKEAVIEITDKGLGCVCIVSKNEQLEGIITDGDVRRVLQQTDRLNDIKAEDIMTKKPISVHKSLLLGEALALMENREKQINVLPVIDESNRMLGLIRIHDIVRSRI